jgi:hypothetical protein
MAELTEADLAEIEAWCHEGKLLGEEDGLRLVAEVRRLQGVVADCRLETVDAETDSAARSREQACEIQRLEAENERLRAEREKLADATSFLVEMAAYAAPHVNEEWSQRGGAGNSNAGDLFNAISEARAALDLNR